MIIFRSSSRDADNTYKIQNSAKNQKVQRKSEICWNFRNFSDFSEDLVSLLGKTVAMYEEWLDNDNLETISVLIMLVQL